jgi:hypothetical protein
MVTTYGSVRLLGEYGPDDHLGSWPAPPIELPVGPERGEKVWSLVLDDVEHMPSTGKLGFPAASGSGLQAEKDEDVAAVSMKCQLGRPVTRLVTEYLEEGTSGGLGDQMPKITYCERKATKDRIFRHCRVHGVADESKTHGLDSPLYEDP